MPRSTAATARRSVLERNLLRLADFAQVAAREDRQTFHISGGVEAQDESVEMAIGARNFSDAALQSDVDDDFRRIGEQPVEALAVDRCLRAIDSCADADRNLQSPPP